MNCSGNSFNCSRRTMVEVAPSRSTSLRCDVACMYCMSCLRRVMHMTTSLYLACAPGFCPPPCTLDCVQQSAYTPAALLPPAASHLPIASRTLAATSLAVVFLPNASTNWPRGSMR